MWMKPITSSTTTTTLRVRRHGSRTLRLYYALLWLTFHHHDVLRLVECHVILNNNRGREITTPRHGRRQGSLDIPEAGPSWEHLSSQRHIAIRPDETGILPLQIYRSVTKPRQQQGTPSQERRSFQRKMTDANEIMEFLMGVAHQPSQFNLSRTTLTLLSNLKDLTPDQCDQLVYRIQMDHQASQPVPIDALEIIYCDEHICVTNKPSGVLSVPGPRHNPSLANLVYDTIRPANVNVDQMIVHRLDMATSGILVYALSLEALSKLHLDFKERRVQKTYQALVVTPGETATSSVGVAGLGAALEGEITVDLERDPENPPFMRAARPKQQDDPPQQLQQDDHDHDESSWVGVVGKMAPTHKFFRQAPKECLTTWTLIRREMYQGQLVSRLDLRPWTGRTHQLRVHCAQGLGTPIVGDNIYGIDNKDEDPSSSSSSSLCLHARQLCIHHPITGAPMIFEADPPF